MANSWLFCKATSIKSTKFLSLKKLCHCTVANVAVSFEEANASGSAAVEFTDLISGALQLITARHKPSRIAY